MGDCQSRNVKMQTEIIPCGTFYADIDRLIRETTDLLVYLDVSPDYQFEDDPLRLNKLRPYNRYGRHARYPRSAGISIMRRRPDGCLIYIQKLDEPGVLKSLNTDLDSIRTLITRHKYSKIYFPAIGDYPRPIIASYLIGEEVRNYITDALYSMKVKV